MKHTCPRSQTISHSQFKKGLGEALKGVFRQLPYPVAGQIPKHAERDKKEKEKRKYKLFNGQKKNEKHADSLTFIMYSFTTKNG